MQVDDDMLITVSESDANTQHISKRVKNVANKNSSFKVGEFAKDRIYLEDNEVAFYRKYRKHNKVNNENNGGRRLPDAYGIKNLEEIKEEEKQFCKKYGIPIIVLHEEKYKNKEEKEKKEETVR